jgi:glycosyltransferase involved in cell wall biosynthesis
MTRIPLLDSDLPETLAPIYGREGVGTWPIDLGLGVGDESSEGGPPARVLHVINGEHYAGAERVQDLLSAALPEFGYEVVFAAVKPDQFGPRRRHQNTPLFETPMRGRADIRPAWDIAEIARRQHCSIIHTHTVRAALVGRIAACLTGLPMVHHLHSPTSADSTRRLQNFCNTIIERAGTIRIAGAVAVSQSLALYGVKHGIPKSRMNVVHNGVPVAGPLPRRENPRGTWTLGCTALFRPRKGLETLLEGLAALGRAGRDVRLRAVGRFETPEYEREIMALADRLGLADRVEWRGFQSDVAAELAAMDLFVLPSLFGEGMPMVVLEAMAHGVPVIATRVEGVPEAVRADVDGLIVTPGDATALAGAVERFIDGQVDWQALRRNAHTRQAESFSDRSMADGLARVYRRVASAVKSRTANEV